MPHAFKIVLSPATEERDAATQQQSDEQAISATLHALIDSGLTDSALRELLSAWESAKAAPRGDRTV